jgi:hypothetical protein
VQNPLVRHDLLRRVPLAVADQLPKLGLIPRHRNILPSPSPSIETVTMSPGTQCTV